MRSLVAGLLLLAAQAPAVAAEPYTLPGSVVLPLHSEVDGEDYLLYVSLPRDYGKDPKQLYPVIYTLDADYAFALAGGITTHFSDRDNLPPVIVVSIGYPGGIGSLDSYHRNRTRDYTPSHTLEGGYGPEFQQYSGGGERFRGFITRELFAYVESHYRADPKDRTLVGHSYGGLFATYVLLTAPEAFRRYIIVSPSLWYDKRMIYAMEESSAKGRKDLAAKVFFGVGAYENDSEYPMADEMREMARKLRARKYPHLEVTDQVFEDETHNSVFPGALSRGLRVVFSDWPGVR